jgi:hypothetical protein
MPKVIKIVPAFRNSVSKWGVGKDQATLKLNLAMETFNYEANTQICHLNAQRQRS